MDNENNRHDLQSLSNLLTAATITCPYCWEAIDITIDQSTGESSYVEDCQVCCQPIVISLNLNNKGAFDIATTREG